MENPPTKYWQDKDGSTGFMRVMSATLIYSGLAMIWLQLAAVVWKEAFLMSEIEWWGPIGIIGMGLTGKAAQKGLS
jgi:Mg2+/citrate symporter